MSVALAKLVERFRAVEDQALIAAVIGDDDAMRVLASFSRFPFRDWKSPRSKAPADDDYLWEWMWEGFTADFVELGERVGLDEEVCQRVFKRLVAARLVYPDGSISGHARILLNAYIAKHLPKPAAPKKKPDAGVKKKK